MIEAKSSFFFSFIEKEAAALRYQLAQEMNYDQKGKPKKRGARERNFAKKKYLKEKEPVTSLLMEKMSTMGNPSTNTRRMFLNIPVQLDVKTAYPCDQPVTVIISGR